MADRISCNSPDCSRGGRACQDLAGSVKTPVLMPISGRLFSSSVMEEFQVIVTVKASQQPELSLPLNTP